MSQGKQDILDEEKKTSLADELTDIKGNNLDKRKKKKKKGANDDGKKEEEHKEDDNTSENQNSQHRQHSNEQTENQQPEVQNRETKEQNEKEGKPATHETTQTLIQNANNAIEVTQQEIAKNREETGGEQGIRVTQVLSQIKQPEVHQQSQQVQIQNPKRELQDEVVAEADAKNESLSEMKNKSQQRTVELPAETQTIKLKEEGQSEITRKQSDKAYDLKQQQEKKEAKQAKDTKQRKRRKRVFKDKQQTVVDKSQPYQQKNTEVASQIVAHQPSFHQILQPTINHAEDVRILSDTAFSKKKQNYNQLRQWSIVRTQQISLHLSVLNQLQMEMQRAIKMSLDHFEIYVSFFRQRANQQEKLIAHPLPNVQYMTHNNEMSKDIYINCSRLLLSFSQENYERCKRSQRLIVRIRKEILMQLLDDHFKKTQLELMRIREKVSTARSLLIKEGTELDKKITKLAKRHASYLTGQNHDLSKDYLKSQLSFLRNAQQHCLIQRKMGQFVFEYLNVARQEQLRRSEILKKSLRMYAEIMEQAYGVKPTQDSLQQLNKVEETKLIPQFYSVQSLLDDKNLNLLRNSMSLPEQTEVTVEILQQFIASYKFPHFNSRILILKQYPVQYEAQHYKLIITVDHFIHLFSDAEPMYAKPHKSIRIQTGLAISSNRDLTVTIKKEEKKGVMGILMWAGKGATESMTVRFQKRDALEEFEEYVDKLV